MGTSSGSGGAGGSNPLIPSWIGTGESGDDNPPENQSPESDQAGNPNNQSPESNDQSTGSDNGQDNQDGNQNNDNLLATAGVNNNQQQTSPATGSRYTSSRKAFNKYVSGGGKNPAHLKNALKTYVRKGGGGSSTLSKRMRPSASRVMVFINTVNNIRDSGKTQVLTQINLAAYINKPLNETLSALSDEIFKDTGKIYEDTQDDSITHQAYSNTIVRICELGEIDLDNLSNENVEVMTSIFIEETIAQRVICDIGNKITKISSDVSMLLEIENNVYQIISGLVRNQIMPEIIATQRSNKLGLDKKIENIYRIAFDAIIGAKD